MAHSCTQVILSIANRMAGEASISDLRFRFNKAQVWGVTCQL